MNANPALLAEANSRAAEQETASQKKRKGGSAGGGGRERKGGKGRRREVEEVESGRTGGRWDHVFMPPKEVRRCQGAILVCGGGGGETCDI